LIDIDIDTDIDAIQAEIPLRLIAQLQISLKRLNPNLYGAFQRRFVVATKFSYSIRAVEHFRDQIFKSYFFERVPVLVGVVANESGTMKICCYEQYRAGVCSVGLCPVSSL